MDSNLFEYLIIIFFIVSALQSLFGKKKKQKQQQQRRQRQTSGQAGTPTPRKEQSPESAKDVLEEMFGLKFPDQEEEKQTKIPSDTETSVLDPAENNETTWRPEEEFEDSLGIETIRYEDRSEEKPSYQEEMEELERKAERAKHTLSELPDKIEVVEVSGASKESKLLAAKIKRTIREPETLREYILVSELLNKPKALRR